MHEGLQDAQPSVWRNAKEEGKVKDSLWLHLLHWRYSKELIHAHQACTAQHRGKPPFSSLQRSCTVLVQHQCVPSIQHTTHPFKSEHIFSMYEAAPALRARYPDTSHV